MKLRFLIILIISASILSAMQPAQWIRNVSQQAQEELKTEDAARATQELAQLANEFAHSTDKIEHLTETLLNRGANPNVISTGYRQHDYVLVHAIHYNPKITKFLLEAGANPNIASLQTNTPIIFDAIADNDIALVRLLLEYNADPDVKDKISGQTPLTYAVATRLPHIAQLLLQHGANPNLSNILGDNALMAAIQNSDVNMVNLLLQAGADPYASQSKVYPKSAFSEAQRKLENSSYEAERKRYQEIIDLFEHPETIKRTGLEKLP